MDGSKSSLTKAEESSLASFCIKLLKCSFPINTEDLFDIVQNVIKQEGRKTPFTDGRPGFYWFHGLMRHNPELTERVPECLRGGRASVPEELIRKWFADTEVYVVNEEIARDVFQDPQRIFNFDESYFLLAKERVQFCGQHIIRTSFRFQRKMTRKGSWVILLMLNWHHP